MAQPRPASGLDWLICARFARYRWVRVHFGAPDALRRLALDQIDPLLGGFFIIPAVPKVLLTAIRSSLLFWGGSLLSKEYRFDLEPIVAWYEAAPRFLFAIRNAFRRRRGSVSLLLGIQPRVG